MRSISIELLIVHKNQTLALKMEVKRFTFTVH